MAVSIFRGAVPVEDWGELGQKIDTSVARYATDRAQRAKEWETTYAKAAAVDPIYTASSYWQADQVKKMDELKKKLGDIYYAYKNKPRGEGLVAINNELAAFNMYQQRLKSDEAKYMDAVKKIQSDPLGKKYDLEHFKKRVDEWTKTGKLSDDLLLPPLIGDIKGWYLSQKPWAGTNIKKQTLKNGRVVETEVPMTQDEMKSQLANEMFSNPSLKRSIEEKFLSLPESEKMNYFNKYDDQNKGNAIIDFAWDIGGKFRPGLPQTERIKTTPSGKTGTGSVPVQISYTNPSDVLVLQRGDTSKEDYDIDTWGSAQFPNQLAGYASRREYFDMKTGEKKVSRYDMPLSNTEIKYIPFDPSDRFAEGEYRNPDGSLKQNYSIKPVLISRDSEGRARGVVLTQELKNDIKTKNPRFADFIDKELPLTISPKIVKQESTNKGIPSSERQTEKKKWANRIVKL